jgi:hypothetical protein
MLLRPYRLSVNRTGSVTRRTPAAPIQTLAPAAQRVFLESAPSNAFRADYSGKVHAFRERLNISEFYCRQ